MQIDGPRACHESELPEVMALANSIFRPDTEQTLETDYPWVFCPDQLKYLRIIRAEDQIVCHVPVVPREVVAEKDHFIIGIISPTGTHPDHRNRSYGTLCLQDCIRIMEENIWPLSVLWTIEPTFPFYQNIGWEAVSSQGWVYQLVGHEWNKFEPHTFEIIPLEPKNPEHLNAVMHLHDAEPFRIKRSPTMYQQMFSLPMINTLMATQSKQVFGYLMFGQGTNKPGLIEAGGSTNAVEALVRQALARLRPDEQVQAPVPLTPTVLQQLLEQKKPGTRLPIEQASAIGHQMVRINSLQALLRSIPHHLCHRSVGICGDLTLHCTDTDESVTLCFNDGAVTFSDKEVADRVCMNQSQLIKLIFGPHPQHTPTHIEGKIGEILRQVFPFYFPIWELDHS